MRIHLFRKVWNEAAGKIVFQCSLCKADRIHWETYTVNDCLHYLCMMHKASGYVVVSKNNIYADGGLRISVPPDMFLNTRGDKR